MHFNGNQYHCVRLNTRWYFEKFFTSLKSITRKILVIRFAPRQRIEPIKSVFILFHVGRVNKGAKTAKTDIISFVIVGELHVLYCFCAPQDT